MFLKNIFKTIRRLYFSIFISRETLNAKSKIRKYENENMLIGFLKRNAFKLVAQHFSNVLINSKLCANSSFNPLVFSKIINHKA